jgi:hypothetical protein
VVHVDAQPAELLLDLRVAGIRCERGDMPVEINDDPILAGATRNPRRRRPNHEAGIKPATVQFIPIVKEVEMKGALVPDQKNPWALLL